MLIRTSEALAEFCLKVQDATFLAVDTEFMREKTYYASLCLVQVASTEHAAAIDTLVPDLDLRPLKALLLDTRITKVFHAATQDLEIFLQKLGEVPTPVFDTQIAATVCGLGEQPGYAKLVKAMLDIDIDKSSQATDWSYRPLSDKQLTYAIGDVTHLCVVYEMMIDKLASSGRSSWVEQEMTALQNPEKYVTEPEDAYKRIKIRRPKRKTLAVLQELAAWREREAQERNIPRPWLVRDDALVEIAQHLPSNKEELGKVRTVKHEFVRSRDADTVLDIIEDALDIHPVEYPELPDRKESYDADEVMVALLQALLRMRCEQHGVAMQLVASKRDLEALAAAPDPDVRARKGWRNTVFGADAMLLRQGRLALTGGPKGVELVELDEEE